MATKETKTTMTATLEADVKSVARAVGASLARQGHKVPHSNLLHALSSALDKRDWHKLKATLAAQPQPTSIASATPTGPAKPDVPGPAVDAWFRTDDHVFDFHFDCRAYLSTATVQELTAIVDVGYGGDYCTDDIAESAPEWDNYGMDDSFSQAWEYLSVVNRSRKHNGIGFEVSVDGAEMLQWLAQHRADALAVILCERNDVKVTAEEPAGWKWSITTTDGATRFSTKLFASQALAQQDAVAELKLLDEELRSLTVH